MVSGTLTSQGHPWQLRNQISAGTHGLTVNGTVVWIGKHGLNTGRWCLEVLTFEQSVRTLEERHILLL